MFTYGKNICDLIILLKKDSIHTGIHGLCTQVLDPGLWTLKSGHWALDAGLWSLDVGLWTLDSVR